MKIPRRPIEEVREYEALTGVIGQWCMMQADHYRHESAPPGTLLEIVGIAPKTGSYLVKPHNGGEFSSFYVRQHDVTMVGSFKVVALQRADTIESESE